MEYVSLRTSVVQSSGFYSPLLLAVHPPHYNPSSATYTYLHQYIHDLCTSYDMIRY